MTRVVRFHKTGGPEVLRIESLPPAPLGAHEVRIRVEAIGINRSEAAFRAGKYPVPVTPPSLIGYEASGIVIALGENVSNVNVGDAICVLPMFRLGEYGVYAEEAVVPARCLQPRPPGLGSNEAAAIWMANLTAMAIIDVAKVGVGDFVIIRAASSSVGIAAVQLARWAGAVPIAATRKSDKAASLKALGAEHVIATDETDLAAEVMRITDGKGARIVFDPVGGPYVETLANAMAPQGILFIYGGLSGQPTPWPHWPAARKGLSLRGWFASEIWNHPERFAKAQTLIRQGLASGHLKPVIAKTFPLVEIVEAHRYLESNQQVGKIVVTVDSVR